MPETTSFDVLGTSINAAPFDEVVARVLSAPEHGERLSVHFATAHSIVEASDNPAVRDAFDNGLVEPDGMPLVWLGRRQGLAVEWVCGPDFMRAVIR